MRPNIAIAASAGSGKTFQLAHRFIEHVASGVPPSRIAALTFSRKAAGEILDSILEQAIKASLSDEGAAETASHMQQIPAPSREQFVQILRALVSSPHRLHIGTLDAFIIGIIRAFPAELGVSPEFDVMDDDAPAAQELRNEVLARIFHPKHLEANARAAFLEAFKQATFGTEEKRPETQITRFIEEYRKFLRLVPGADGWGNRDRIWPEPAPWQKQPGDIDASCDALASWFRNEAGASEAHQERFLPFLVATGAFSPTSPWDDSVKKIFAKLAEIYPGLLQGHGELKLNRSRYPLEGPVADHALVIVHHIIRTVIESRLTLTQGLHRILSRFDALYTEESRRSGRMTFLDAQEILAGCADGSLPAISRSRGDTTRLYIDYRLDAELDHWLLDEFQDTNDLQWGALANMLDEIIQDSSGTRSLFYVGDVKQAIYGWRGGNARLFDQLQSRYEKRFDYRSLHASFRSAPPIIDTVNGIFTHIDNEAIPENTRSRWNQNWKAHLCSGLTSSTAGYAALVEPRAPEGAKPSEEDRLALTAAIIREIDPIRKGLSTAVLVRSNKLGEQMVDVIRANCPGIPVIHEGKAPIADNPVVNVLLSLLQFAVHPGDTFACRHVMMSPLGSVIAELGLTQERLPLHILSRVAEDGIEKLLIDWGERLNAAQPLDSFGARRLSELIAAAAEFEGGGRRDLPGFLRFARSHQVGETAAASAVRVMTIHQAKGLGFDVVLLPDLMSTGGLTAPRDLTMLQGAPPSPGEAPPWLLRAPVKDIAALDAELSASINRAGDDQTFEALCVLYVALTRAKRALYMISSFPGKSSKALSPAALIKEQLKAPEAPDCLPNVTYSGIAACCLYAAGSADWHSEIEPQEEAEPSTATSPWTAADAGQAHLVPVEPSGSELRLQPAAYLFNPQSNEVLEFGSAIHALLEQVEWAETLDVDAVIDAWQKTATVSPDVNRDVATQFRAMWDYPDVKNLLGKPEGPARLWREKPFEILTEDGRWLRGVFDRVVIHLDAEGTPQRAEVTDFKSNMVHKTTEIDNAVQTYTPQLNWYGRAIAQILKLPPENITLQLLFTRPGIARDVPWD